MYRKPIERILEDAVRKAFEDRICELEDFFNVSLELSANDDYGDYSSVIAIRIANALSLNTSVVAEKIIDAIDHLPPFCSTVKATPNGFINITLTRDSLYYGIMSILHKGEGFSPPDLADGMSVHFIGSDSMSLFSLNANDGRRMLLADFFKRIFPRTGYTVGMDTLVRDSGEMLWVFAYLVEHHYREYLGDDSQLLYTSYRNKSAVEAAKKIIDSYGASFLPILREQRIAVMKDEAPELLAQRVAKAADLLGCDFGKIVRTENNASYLDVIEEIIAFFSSKELLYYEPVVPFKNWISSQSEENRKFYEERGKRCAKDKVAEEYPYWKSQFDKDGNILRTPDPEDSFLHLIYRYEDQLWLKSTDFGDTEDHIVFLPRLEPSDFLINLVFIIRAMKSGGDKIVVTESSDMALELYNQVAHVLKFMGYNPKNLEFIPVEKVLVTNLSPEQEPVRGESVDIAQLLDVIGKNMLTFSCLSKSPLNVLEIDCKLLKEEDSSHPLAEIRLAFDRIKKLFKMASSNGFPTTSSVLTTIAEVKDLKVLTDECDLKLIKLIIRYPSVICDVVTQYNPSILVNFIIELSETFNRYYTNIKILSGQESVIVARLAVIQALKTVLDAGISLLNIKI